MLRTQLPLILLGPQLRACLPRESQFQFLMAMNPALELLK
jgi:hypothetical protein